MVFGRKSKQPQEILHCGGGGYNGTAFLINQSTDLGNTWKNFIVLTEEISSNSELVSVGYDPLSGNYSFVHECESEAYFVTTNRNGTKFTSSGNILDGRSSTATESYSGDIKINLMPGTGSNTWFLTTSKWFSTSPLGLTFLAKTESTGDGNIQPWSALTEITGDKFETLYVGTEWELLYSQAGDPVLITALMDYDNMVISPLNIFAKSSTRASSSTNLESELEASLQFFGLSKEGVPLADGTYTWDLIVTDEAGNTVTRSGEVIIDTTVPTLYGAIGQNPSPSHPTTPTTITVNIQEINPGTATLSYQLNGGQWNDIIMASTNVGGITTYTTTIPTVLDASRITWKISVEDLAGNLLILDNNGSFYEYIEPSIRLEEQVEPPSTLDLNIIKEYDLIFLVPEDAEFVDHLYLVFWYGTTSGPQTGSTDSLKLNTVYTENFTRTSAGVYNFSFTNIPDDAVVLSYQVYAVDIFGNTVEFGKTRTIALVPALPSWDMVPSTRIIVVVVSFLIGIISGLVYSGILRGRKSGGRKMPAGLDEDGVKNSTSVPKVKKLPLVIGALTFLTCVVFAELSLFVWTYPEVAMLLLGGAMLSNLFVWVMFTDYEVTRAFREDHDHIRASLVLVIGITIFVTLALIFVVGNQVAWWRVRVNQQAYSLGGYLIPRTIVTLAGTFFSSVVLLTRVVSREVKRTVANLKDAELHNENPGRIVRQRQEAVNRIMRGVGTKGILFLGIIGFSIIFASDLNQYSTQGALIILPFVLGALIVLVLTGIRGKGDETPLSLVLHDRLVACPHCGTQTALGGSYCEHCGGALITGVRYMRSIACPSCKKPNPEGTKHCRYCAAEISSPPTQPTQDSSEIPIQ